MEIIKDGTRNTGAFTFKCKKCGCVFKADVSDYDFWDSSAETMSNVPTDIIQCDCPNCGKSIQRNLYTDTKFKKIKKILTTKFEENTEVENIAKVIIAGLLLIFNIPVYIIYANKFTAILYALLVILSVIEIYLVARDL